MFSLFKKDAKDDDRQSRAANRAPAKPVGKPLPDPSQRGVDRSIANRELARSLAMETAAKIDAIESEMAKDFLRPAANTVSPQGADTKTAAAKAKGPGTLSGDDGFDEQAFFGSANAIELTAPSGGSVIDETAILFSNGQVVEAETVLRAGIDSDSLGQAVQSAWLMLFELVNQRGDKAAFEQLILNFALGFENSPPAWVDYAQNDKPAAPVAAGGPVVRLPEAVDAQIVKLLEQLKAAAAQHESLTLDLSACKSVDLVGADLVLRVLNAFKKSDHALTLVGVEQLCAALMAAVQPGRRDASDAAWMLLLESLRLLNRHNDFEEAAIQYCVTFEVSPPSWEAPPANLKVKSGAVAAPKPAAAPVARSPFEWTGVIDGEGEPLFGKLSAEASGRAHLQVECRMLRRISFAAATALVGTVMKLQGAGCKVEFVNVNPMVAALFNLVGVTAVATVHPRRG